MAPEAGYSGTPLPRKLGIKPGHEVAVLGGPASVAGRLGGLPGVAPPRRGLTGSGPLDVIVCFVTWRAELEGQLAGLRARMAPAAGLWIAWPKRAARPPAEQARPLPCPPLPPTARQSARTGSARWPRARGKQRWRGLAASWPQVGVPVGLLPGEPVVPRAQAAGRDRPPAGMAGHQAAAARGHLLGVRPDVRAGAVLPVRHLRADLRHRPSGDVQGRAAVERPLVRESS